jgi:hypothetical protein
MASRLVREKSTPVVMVELLEKAKRLPKTADWRPPPPVVQQAQEAMLRLEIRQEHWTEPIALLPKTADWASSRLRRASWIPPLPRMRQGRATIRRVLFVVPAKQSDQRAPAFFAPDRRL